MNERVEKQQDCLVWSIVNLLFCFFWLGIHSVKKIQLNYLIFQNEGIPAVSLSCRARDNFEQGFITQGNSNAFEAQILNIHGFTFGLILLIIFVFY